MSEREDQADFSDAFCAFLQSCVTSVNAAEVLLVLWRKPEQAWSIGELAAEIEPIGSLTEAEARPYIEIFDARGLISRLEDGRVRYQSSTAFDAQVQSLARLYIERPVTLFRVIYALRDTKIKTLADAFRIWRS